jgi:hypothetical protein
LESYPDPGPEEAIPVQKITSQNNRFSCKYCGDAFAVELALFKHYEQEPIQ